MILLIECLIGIILFTLIVVPLTLKDPLGSVGDYPPAIRERCIELGLVSKTEKRFTTKELIKKVIAMIVFTVLFSFVVYKFNGADTFIDGFVNSYIIWLAVDWYDAIVLDCIWFCHSKKVMIKGTEDMKEYKEAERDIIKYLVKYEDADDEKIQRTIRGAIMVKMNVLKQISSRGKVRGAIDIIHNTIDGADGQKLIVFCYLKEVVQALRQEFKGAVTVTGDDSQQAKQYAVDKFQNDTACKLIILNYKSGGVGLTLTAASNVLFVEFPYTFSDCCQAEDRAHRNGQKNAVNCVYLLGKDTIDEYFYNLIQTKKNISDGVTGTDDNTLQEMVNENDLIFGAAMHLFGNKK